MTISFNLIKLRNEKISSISFSDSPSVIECSIISYTRWWDDVTWKEVGLRTPGAQKTTNFISRMR